MHSNEETVERKIFAQGEKFKIFTTEQGYENWMATILFKNNGLTKAHSVIALSRSEAHKKAFNWVKANTHCFS